MFPAASRWKLWLVFSLIFALVLAKVGAADDTAKDDEEILELKMATPEELNSESEGERRRRIRRVGCELEECPEEYQPQLWPLNELHMPNGSEVYMREVTQPWASELLSIGSGVDDRVLWQLRTVTILDDDDTKHILVPFLLASGVPHVYGGTVLARTLYVKGAEEGEASLTQCFLRVSLPLNDTLCVRQYNPSQRINAHDARKNHVGGLQAAAIVALHALARLASPQFVLTDAVIEASLVAVGVHSELARTVMSAARREIDWAIQAREKPGWCSFNTPCLNNIPLTQRDRAAVENLQH